MYPDFNIMVAVIQTQLIFRPNQNISRPVHKQANLIRRGQANAQTQVLD